MITPDHEQKIVEGISGAKYESVPVPDEHLEMTERLVVPIADDGIIYSADPG